MVLKKPYAFLIKHFRLIHALLILPIIYILYRTSRVVTFFNSYAKEGNYEYANNLAANYINVWMYLAVVLILLVVIIITYLFILKKKSIKLYLGIIIYYVILMIGFTIVYSGLASLEDEIMKITTVRIYRDVSFIFYLPQYFFLIYDVIRAIGFDIKKFDFNKDLKELEIEEKDSEEVEITFDRDNYVLRRKIHRYLREFKYYFFENQFIITIIGIIIAVGLAIFGFYNYILYHRTYKQMQIVNINGFKYKINSSIITNMDYRGNKDKLDKYYLAVSIDITNITQNSIKVEKKDLTLDVDGKYYYPIYDRGDYFNDLGVPYRGEKIKPKRTKTYAVVYEISKKDLNKKFSILIINEYNVHKNDLVATKKYIKLNPAKYLSSNKINEVGLKKEMSFKGSIIGDSKLTIFEAYLNGYYEYKSGDIKKIVTPDYSKYGFGYAIIGLKDEFKSSNANYYADNMSKKDLYNNHGSIYYKYGDNYLMSEVIDVTPSDLKGVSLLQVDKRCLNSSDIRLVISLRNRSYFIKIGGTNE